MDHRELKEKALQDSKTKEMYDQMKSEFDLLRKILAARRQSGITQMDVAKRMNVKACSVARLESSLLSGKHSPSIKIRQSTELQIENRSCIRKKSLNN